MYGIYPNVKVTIEDVSDEKKIIQDMFTFLIIFGQWFNTTTHMEAKGMDNGLAYDGIRNRDRKKNC